MKVMMVNYTMDAKMFIKLLNAEIVMKLLNSVIMKVVMMKVVVVIVKMMNAREKKKVHRNYKRGGYGSERRQSDCESDCERSERCNYPFCELYEDNCDLLLTLCDGVLHDDRHATGEIVANHQFQFDKPPQKMPYIKGIFHCLHSW